MNKSCFLTLLILFTTITSAYSQESKTSPNTAPVSSVSDVDFVKFNLSCVTASDTCLKVNIPSHNEEILIEKEPVLTLNDIASAEIKSRSMDPHTARAYESMGEKPASKIYSVLIRLNDNGKEKLKNVTTKNINKRLAIFIDNKLIMAPNILEPLEDGVMQITGMFTEQKCADLVNDINSAITNLQK